MPRCNLCGKPIVWDGASISYEMYRDNFYHVECVEHVRKNHVMESYFG